MTVPADLIARAHDAGILWIQQVVDRREAEEALAAGADVIVAQGGEAGGHCGWVSTMVLVPQVVDVAGDIPVVAAGGIADGRGLAAALALGAQGVQHGHAVPGLGRARRSPRRGSAGSSRPTPPTPSRSSTASA